jgi:hypothetical protein
LLESIQGQSQPHNGRGILSILPPLKMSGQKIATLFAPLGPFLGVFLWRPPETTYPQKSAFLKKKASVIEL